MCTHCELDSYHYTKAIFQENQEELKTKFFAGIKTLYSSNIASNLYCCTFIVSISPGAYICPRPVSCTDIITQMQFSGKTRKELETSFLCRKRQNLLILNTFEKLTTFDFKFLLVSSLGFSGMLFSIGFSGMLFSSSSL